MDPITIARDIMSAGTSTYTLGKELVTDVKQVATNSVGLVKDGMDAYLASQKFNTTINVLDELMKGEKSREQQSKIRTNSNGDSVVIGQEKTSQQVASDYAAGLENDELMGRISGLKIKNVAKGLSGAEREVLYALEMERAMKVGMYEGELENALLPMIENPQLTSAKGGAGNSTINWSKAKDVDWEKVADTLEKMEGLNVPLPPKVGQSTTTSGNPNNDKEKMTTIKEEKNIPLSPPGVNVDKNIVKAQTMTPIEFYNYIRNGGTGDYKQQGSEYQDFGNFNYGATGRAAGFPCDLLLRMAGWAQQQAGTSKLEWGEPWGKAPYGDDPSDQILIKQGMDYYDKKYNK